MNERRATILQSTGDYLAKINLLLDVAILVLPAALLLLSPLLPSQPDRLDLLLGLGDVLVEHDLTVQETVLDLYQLHAEQ